MLSVLHRQSVYGADGCESSGISDNRRVLSLMNTMDGVGVLSPVFSAFDG
jgi:hypothetical protein